MPDIFFPANVLRKYMDVQVFCRHFIFQIRFGIRFPARNPSKNRIKAGNFLFCLIIIASPCTSLLVLCEKYSSYTGNSSELPIMQKRILQAGFSACGGSLQRHDSSPAQCDPARRAFYVIGTQKSYINCISLYNLCSLYMQRTIYFA